jgi:hypothetical protein
VSRIKITGFVLLGVLAPVSHAAPEIGLRVHRAIDHSIVATYGGWASLVQLPNMCSLGNGPRSVPLNNPSLARRRPVDPPIQLEGANLVESWPVVELPLLHCRLVLEPHGPNLSISRRELPASDGSRQVPTWHKLLSSGCGPDGV